MPDTPIDSLALDHRSPTKALTIGVGVIGCGQWGRNLVRTFSELGALRAVTDSSHDVATSVASEFRVPARSMDSLLEDDALQAVVVASPAQFHAELTSRALRAGKHVFVEKPLALDVSDAEHLRQEADDRRRVLMVGHLLRYHPAFIALKELVDGGSLGRLLYVYSNRLNFGRFRREENALWSFAPHDISMILALAGEEPTRVSAEGAPILHAVLDDVTTTHLEFANGLRAHIFVSWLHPFKEQKLVVVGERGMAVFDDGQPWEAKLVHYRHQVDWRAGVPTPAKADGLRISLEPAEPLRLEAQHFISCCSTGDRPRTDGSEGVRVLRVLRDAQRAMRSIRSSEPASINTGVFVHESSFVDEPAEIGAGTKIWHFSHVLAACRIGRNCVIGQNVSIGPGVTIGDNCKIQNNVSLYQGVMLEDGVFCGPSAVFTNVTTPRAEVDRRREFALTTVGRGATIGANATIVCGHHLGPYSFVAAGAVVTGDVPAYALVAGNPARRVGWVSAAGERLGPDLVCPRTGERYREAGPDELEVAPA